MKHLMVSMLAAVLALPAVGHTAPVRQAAAKKPAPHAASAADLAAKVHSDLLRAQSPARDRPFSDVPPDHWAAAAVRTLRQRGIVVGYPAETSRTK